MKELDTKIVTKEKIELMKPYSRVFQGVVSLLANLKFGIIHTGLIFKYEGGVNVNGREIVIYKDMVSDDFKKLDVDPSKEEKEVARIIEKIFKDIDLELLPDSFQEWFNFYIEILFQEELNKFVSNPFGDQLNSFFGD